jgi:hypothetical protein
MWSCALECGVRGLEVGCEAVDGSAGAGRLDLVRTYSQRVVGVGLHPRYQSSKA